MPSNPTVLARLREMTGEASPLTERILEAAAGFRERSGQVLVPLTPRDLGVTLRASVGHDNSAPVSSKALRPGYVDWSTLPARGGRVSVLLNVVESKTHVVSTANETARGEVAAPVRYNLDLLPESGVTFVASDVPSRRIGAWVPVTNGALEDPGQVDDMVRNVLTADLLRGLDAQVLNGDGTGENFLGLTADAAIAAQARGTDSNAVAILRAAATVRGADFAGPISVVLSAANAVATVTDGAFKADALDALGVERVVFSSRLAAGTALVGSLAEAASLYVREGATISLSRDHADFWLRGNTAVAVEGRFSMKLRQAGAVIRVTGLA